MISYYQRKHGGVGSTGSNVVTAVGGTIMSAAILAGPAAPLVAAVGALVALGGVMAGALHIGEGCGPTCIQATQVVNGAEPSFKMNLDAYEAGTIDQATALDRKSTRLNSSHANISY